MQIKISTNYIIYLHTVTKWLRVGYQKDLKYLQRRQTPGKQPKINKNFTKFYRYYRDLVINLFCLMFYTFLTKISGCLRLISLKSINLAI